MSVGAKRTGQWLPIPTIAVPAGQLLRKCDCGGTCATCQLNDAEKRLVQRRVAPTATAAISAGRPLPRTLVSEIHSAAARGGGQSLPGEIRARLQPQLGGRDLSGVRIHADSAAARLAQRLGAEAFTAGQHIFFAPGRYAPGNSAGHKLLVHELVHVVQQGSAAARLPGAHERGTLELGAPDTAAEREADRIAEQVSAGGTSGPITSRAGDVVQRKVVELAAAEPLEIPGEKAESAADHQELVKLYQSAADRQALRTTHAGRGLDLWPAWERSRSGHVNAAQQSASEVRQAMQSQCSPDHILELQVNGPDDPNNLRLLSRGRNSHAGSILAGQIRRLENQHLGNPSNRTDYLVFKAVRAKGSPASDPCLAADPWKYPAGQVATGRGTHQAPYSQRLQFQAGGVARAIGYGAARETAAPFTVNPDHRYALAGLELLRVKSVAGTTAVLEAQLSPKVRRMPLQGSRPGIFEVRVAGGQLDFSTAPTAVRLGFSFMSEATLLTRIEAGQMVARGDLIPSLPILRESRVALEIRDDALQARAQIPAAALQRALPIPGLTVNDCSLAISATDGAFTASGGVAFQYGQLASGQVTATLSNQAGFQAQGQLRFQIPGLDQATGSAWIRGGRLGARVELGKDKFRWPGVSSARVEVVVQDGRLDGSGAVQLAIPGLGPARLEFRADSRGVYSLTGTATGSIPGLRSPSLTLTYAAGELSGQGTAGFSIPGFEGGAVTLQYARGQLTGSASLDYRRGRLAGRLTARLGPTGRLSGGGELAYQIAPGLSALVGLEIRENGTARIAGELRLPDPIMLFPERGFQKRLLGLSLDIPIFGISFGSRSVGLIANLSAALEARAGVGPGQIRRPRILAAFDPSQEAGATSFQAAGELYVPATAELSLVLSAGIGASLLIVKALGGLQARGSVGLLGALSVPIELKYVQNRFTVQGAAEIFAQPKFRFQLDAFVKVEADLLLTTIELYARQWKLAAWEWGSDFRIGLRFPVSYTFGEPFRLSLDQVQFIAPTIDVRRLVRDLLPK
ncbi:MAG: DUF4157 domain-containing protein [Pirellulales bacterium]